MLTFGHMAAGNLRNIVADEGILEGILRSYDDAMQEKLIGEFQRVARAAASVYGVEVGFAQHCYYPPVVNDAALVARVMPLIDAHAPQQPLLTAGGLLLLLQGAAGRLRLCRRGGRRPPRAPAQRPLRL